MLVEKTMACHAQEVQEAQAEGGNGPALFPADSTLRQEHIT